MVGCKLATRYERDWDVHDQANPDRTVQAFG